MVCEIEVERKAAKNTFVQKKAFKNVDKID
jgi:hypothetical protein